MLVQQGLGWVPRVKPPNSVSLFRVATHRTRLPMRLAFGFFLITAGGGTWQKGRVYLCVLAAYTCATQLCVAPDKSPSTLLHPSRRHTFDLNFLGRLIALRSARLVSWFGRDARVARFCFASVEVLGESQGFFFFVFFLYFWCIFCRIPRKSLAVLQNCLSNACNVWLLPERQSKAKLNL